MNRDWTIRRGISMAETIISTILVGFVLVSTLQIVGPMVRSTSVHADRLVAASLAHELAEEIGTKWYTEPDLDSLDARGVDDGERAAQRTDFDDVDGLSHLDCKSTQDFERAVQYFPWWMGSISRCHLCRVERCKDRIKGQIPVSSESRSQYPRMVWCLRRIHRCTHNQRMIWGSS